MDNKPTSLINPQFVLVTISGFLFFLSFHSFILLPIGIEDLGGSKADIGFIMGAAGLTTLFSTPLVGIMADKFGRKPFLALGGLILALSAVPFVYLESIYPWYLVLRAIQGGAFSLAFIAAGTLAADLTPPANRSQALGIFGVFTIVNYALAPFFGKRIVEHYGFDTLFIVVSVVAVLSFLTALMVKEPAFKTRLPDAGTLFTTIKRKGVLIAAVALFISGSGFIPALTFLPVFSVDIGIRNFDIFFIAYTAAALIVRLAGGWIPDKFGKKRAAVPSMLIFALSIMGLSVLTNSSQLVPLGVLFGIGHALVYPSVYAIAMDLVREGEQGKAFSICSMAFTVGGMFGLFIYGLVAEHSGYRDMYLLTGMVCVAGFALFALFGREKK